MKELKVYGYWPSPYSRRVEIALKIKGVEYEYVEEDVHKIKSQELIQYNPVHKKVPVLLHAGNPIVESLIILEYIDEIWKDNPILPSDPYERAQARFWAKFLDDKFAPLRRTALMTQGEEAEKAREDLEEMLKVLENEIKEGNKLFEAKEVGFIEIVGTILAYWTPILEEASGKQLLTKEKYPAIWAWAKRIVGFPIIQENMPAKHAVLAAYKAQIATIKANNPN